MKTKMAMDLVTTVDEKVEDATEFIMEMRSESESLVARAKTGDIRADCKKVSDAFRFSDPMSRESLASVEVEIKVHYRLFEEAVAESDPDLAHLEAEELQALIAERNSKCKLMK